MTAAPVELERHWLGETQYAAALALQRRLRQAVLAGEHPGALLLLTHPHTVTLGRHAEPANILAPQVLAAAGCEVHRVERGGDVTYHGPGQLVGYPIFDLRRARLGPRKYVMRLAATLADVLRGYDVDAAWDDDAPGLWIGRDKIAAFGVHVHRHVAIHGFSLNVDPALEFFTRIAPCGFNADSRGVTSLAKLLGERAPTLESVCGRVTERFSERFHVAWVSPETESNIIGAVPSKQAER